MKNLFKGAVLTAAAAFAFTACSKEQRVVNRLEGEWKVKTIKEYENGILSSSGDGLDGGTLTFDFEKCKLKSDDYCDLIITSVYNNDTETELYKYKISDDGETLVVDSDYNTNSTTDQESFVITESSKKIFKISVTEIDGSDTYKTEYEMEPK